MLWHLFVGEDVAGRSKGACSDRAKHLTIAK
jgi:hypothetical protein